MEFLYSGRVLDEPCCEEEFERAEAPFTACCELVRPGTADFETPAPAEGSFLLEFVEAACVPAYDLEPPDELALEVREASLRE